MLRVPGLGRVYATSTGMLLLLLVPPGNQPNPVADLEEDPVVEHVLSIATCQLYHHYGMYLAPLTITLTTLKHCQFRKETDARIE